MAFDFGSGMTMGAEGAKVGTSIMPGWGTAIGAGVGFIAGGYIGGKKKKEAKKWKRLQKKYLFEIAKISKWAGDMGVELSDEWRDFFKPVQELLAKQAISGEFAAPEHIREKYAADAQLEVAKEMKQARKMTDMRNRQFGVDPTSGRAQALRHKEALMGGLAEAGAGTQAMRQADEDVYKRRKDIADMGTDILQGAYNFGNLGMKGYSQAYDMAGAQYGQTRADAKAQMGVLNPKQLAPYKDIGKIFKKGEAGSVGGYNKEGFHMNEDQGYFGPNLADGGQAAGMYAFGQQPVGMAQGGAVEGPGGPVDDEIPAEVPAGAYVIPADVVEALGVDYFDKLVQTLSGMPGGVDGMQHRANAMLSSGEYVVPAEVVKRKGKQFFDKLVEKHHRPSTKQDEQYQAENMGAQPGEAQFAFQPAESMPLEDVPMAANGFWMGQEAEATPPVNMLAPGADAPEGGGLIKGNPITSDLGQQWQKPAGAQTTLENTTGMDMPKYDTDKWKKQMFHHKLSVNERHGPMTSGMKWYNWKQREGFADPTKQNLVFENKGGVLDDPRKRAAAQKHMRAQLHQQSLDKKEYDEYMARPDAISANRGYMADGGGVSPTSGRDRALERQQRRANWNWGEPFDPEGSGYDYNTAIAAGIEPDDKDHWSSREPETGMILKGRQHETYNKAMEEDDAIGYHPYKMGGRYFTEHESMDGGQRYAFNYSGPDSDADEAAEAEANLPHRFFPGTGTDRGMADGGLSRGKAREMLRHGEVRGKPITKAQRGYFGAVAGGKAADGGRVLPMDDWREWRGATRADIRKTAGANAEKHKKTRRAGKKHKKMADGGPVKYSKEWYQVHGQRPKPGDVGPAPRKTQDKYKGVANEKQKNSATEGYGTWYGKHAGAPKPDSED